MKYARHSKKHTTILHICGNYKVNLIVRWSVIRPLLTGKSREEVVGKKIDKRHQLIILNRRNLFWLSITK
jgi:hypothetical protein